MISDTQDRLFRQTAMNELSSHHFQFAANFSSDIVFESDVFNYDVKAGNT